MPYYALIAIVVGISLLVSFACSLLEACIYSISRSRIETLRRSGDARGRILARLRSRIDETIAAILIMNTLSNILGASFAAALVSRHYGDRALGYFSGALTVVILILGEMFPKSLGVRFAPRLAPTLSYLLMGMVWVLTPVIKVTVMITRLLGAGHSLPHGTQDDIISLARLVETEGTLYPHEAEWVANVLQLDESTAYDLMTPNPVVGRVPVNMKLSETKINADHWRFSRLPVCAPNDPDKILGIAHRRDVFDALARDEFHKTMGDLMKPMDFVPENIPAHRLLDKFLHERRHLFCVYDENNQFTGVVSLEDVIECLLGREIVDETDLHEDMQELARKRKEALLARGARPRPGER